jgi:nitroreductase
LSVWVLAASAWALETARWGAATVRRMDLRDALRTTGAVRSFTDEPVSDETVSAVLDDARFAPSGGNRQGWRVAVLKDSAVRLHLGALMQGVWDEYAAIAATGVTPFAATTPKGYSLPAARSGPIGNSLISGIDTIPVVLAVAVDLGLVSMMDNTLGYRPAVTGGGSIYPFCWSIVLAARARGLGGVITTFLSHVEPDAAPLLGLPSDHALAATIFLGHPVKQPTKLTRRPVESFTTIDRFDGPTFGYEGEPT